MLPFFSFAELIKQRRWILAFIKLGCRLIFNTAYLVLAGLLMFFVALGLVSVQKRNIVFVGIYLFVFLLIFSSPLLQWLVRLKAFIKKVLTKKPEIREISAEIIAIIPGRNFDLITQYGYDKA